MAIYNEILSARFARALQKLFSMKGEQAMKQLSGELMAVQPFASGTENRILEDWSRFAQSDTVAAQGAGNIAAYRIRNPAGSNVVAVLEGVTIQSASQDTYNLQLGTTNVDLGLGPTNIPVRLDARGPSSSTAVTSKGTAGQLSRNVKTVSILSNSYAEFLNTDLMEMPVLPGDAYQVVAATANTAIIVTFIWRERRLEESELKV